mgnify:CR=1 FL=1
MTRRRILAATKTLLLAAILATTNLHQHVAAVMESRLWAAETAKPRSVAADFVSADTLVDKALRAMGGAEEIVFVIRDLCSAYQWYATFGEYADEAKYIHAPDGSQLCKLNLRTRQVAVLLDDPQGGFRDPRVHYDGGKVLFAYRPGGTHHYHLCEINVDGSGFRQLTFGDCDDVDPAYLPDGGIVFASSRCHRFVACNRVPAAVIHRMDADGGNIRCLSANTISEDRPAVLPDGRARRGIGFDRRRFLDYCLRSCSC